MSYERDEETEGRNLNRIAYEASVTYDAATAKQTLAIDTLMQVIGEPSYDAQKNGYRDHIKLAEHFAQNDNSKPKAIDLYTSVRNHIEDVTEPNDALLTLCALAALYAEKEHMIQARACVSEAREYADTVAGDFDDPDGARIKMHEIIGQETSSFMPLRADMSYTAQSPDDP